MDFVLTSCPYCGREVDSNAPGKYVCQSCGKYIYSRRYDITSFLRPSEIEDRYKEALAAMEDGNEKKAMEIAEDLVEATGPNNHDSLFLRGYLYALQGEDGKALADWKKAMSLLSNDPNLDAYVCLMSRAITEMIHYKEREFVEFNEVAFIDKLCEEIDADSGMSCKSFVYYTILRDCQQEVYGQEEELEEIKDVIPNLFRRVVAYQRDYWALPRTIEQYLRFINYNEETFEEDDNEVPHVYYLLQKELERRIADLTEEDRIRIFDRWDDASLKENIEPMLDALVGPKRGGLLGKLRHKEVPDMDLESVIRSYVEKCLLIEAPEAPASERGAP